MKKVKEYLEKVFNQNNIAGMSVAVTDKKGTLGIFNFGVQNSITGEPITNDSRFRIASITKVILGLTAMRLVEQNKLSLSDKVGKFVEWLNPTLSNLTIESLLSHTAGLPVEYTPDGPRDEGLLENSLKDELSKVDLSKVGNGSGYLYSNLGIRLVSLVIEKITGKRFSRASNELVIKPLKMDKTFYPLKEALKLPLSLPHAQTENGFKPVEMWENAVRYGAGGLFSTTEDLCKLARFILNYGVNDNGERLLKRQTIEKMVSPRTPNGKGDFYGITQMLHTYKGRLLGGHLGSAPPYCANLVTDFESGYGVAVVINTENNEHLRYEITDAVLDALTNR
ncbi:MAG: beta-lactamase family protein [Clostridia bacterium]|nr:beta-lactamase family protein [Clostridia bacterium]